MIMPSLFIGHGSPMNAIAHNDYSILWGQIGSTLPIPKVILVISAHWYISKTFITAMPFPKTIHDFGGFPKELFDFNYPAKGSLEFANRLKDLLVDYDAGLNFDWGLDHGAWSILAKLFPAANIPVVQLSINKNLSNNMHYEIGQKLSVLREEDVLIIGSGNIVHNLSFYNWSDDSAYDWAFSFDKTICDLISKGDDNAVINYENIKGYHLSVPTKDHYLPLLYILGTKNETDKVTFPVVGFQGGSISMSSFQLY